MLITLQDTPALRLHTADDVAIALVPLSANRRIEIVLYPKDLSQIAAQ